MSKAQVAALNKASKEITGMTFLSAIHKQHPDLLEVAHKALEYYGLACLEKAANNAKIIYGALDYEVGEIDKSSINSKENLA